MKTSFFAKTKTFIQMSYIFLIVILECLQSFFVNSGLTSDVNNFLFSDLNYFLMLSVTLITVITGIAYFFEKDNSLINTTI